MMAGTTRPEGLATQDRDRPPVRLIRLTTTRTFNERPAGGWWRARRRHFHATSAAGGHMAFTPHLGRLEAWQQIPHAQVTGGDYSTGRRYADRVWGARQVELPDHIKKA